MCKAGDFNLLYESLTSFQAGQALRDLPVSDLEFFAELVRWQSQQQAPTLSAEEAESEDLEESSLDVFRDDSEVPLKEVLRVQEEPLVENADDVIEFNDHDYKLEDRGGLISNADAETTFIECVNNVTVDATPRGRGLWKKRKNVLYSSNWWTDNSNNDSDKS